MDRKRVNRGSEAGYSALSVVRVDGLGCLESIERF